MAKTSRPSGGPFAAREQLEQDAVWSAIGRHLHVVDVRAGELAPGLLEESLELGEIALPDLPRLRVDLALVLHAEEPGRVVEGKVQLLAIEEVEDDNVVAAPAERLVR